MLAVKLVTKIMIVASVGRDDLQNYKMTQLLTS